MAEELNDAQKTLLACYESLRRLLAERRAELAPFEERNAQKALAALWQIANGLDQEPGHLYDLGV
jgi:hypothetical protein